MVRLSALVEVHQVVAVTQHLTEAQTVSMVEAVEELELSVKVLRVELVLVLGTQVLVVELVDQDVLTPLLVVLEFKTAS
jgi:hypothetical protein